MKLIVAIIRPECLDAVQAALAAEEVCLLSVGQVLGDGREPGYTEMYRGRVVHVQRPKVRLEIAADKANAEAAVKAIVRAASTGDEWQPGDGMVLVLPLDECVRICDGERPVGPPNGRHWPKVMAG
jgi:nitrogen regulatory protein P-II 1